MQLSIVIPLLNEEESLTELHSRIRKICEEKNYTYEIIFVDDGSTDNSWENIKKLTTIDSYVKGIRFSRNYGKSQALNAAFKIAKGNVVITMDADLQDFPEEIPELYSLITNNDYDLVSGWKKKRHDNILTKNIPSKLFNQVARITSGVRLNDFNCGLKAYKSKVIKTIDVYGDMHRYIPVLAKNAGFNKIGEKEVKHQARLYGKSKFGAERFVRGFLDLITLWFMSKFGSRPMHFFGAMGTIMFIFGFFITLYIGISKLVKVYQNIPAKLITTDAWFYIAISMMILGTQFFLAGFLGELIIKLKRSTKEDYIISENINI